jgi:hypothetical protein
MQSFLHLASAVYVMSGAIKGFSEAIASEKAHAVAALEKNL